MAGLLSRQQTGKGVWIDCNLFETQVGHTASFILSGSFTYWLVAPDRRAREYCI